MTINSLDSWRITPPPGTRLLITGGAGFLGRHLARRSAERGWFVSVLDDLSCANSSFSSPELDHSNITCIHGSILDAKLLAELLPSHPLVVHFASVVGVGETIDRPIATARNLTGTLNIVERLMPHHTILFGSSADVYGMHSRVHGRPMREDDDVVFEHAQVNRWVYPKVKAVEENVIAASAARSVTVRIFNCIGPGMDYPEAKRVIPRFVEAIRAREPIRLNGSGAQIRCFCYYTDTLDGIERALDFAASRPPGPGGPFNIGSDQPTSIRDLAELMNRIALEVGLLHERLPIVRRCGELYSQDFRDDWDRIPDLTRARSVLGFSPQIGLETALRRTLASVRQVTPLDVSLVQRA
jgi:UDP-glucose 4-epimerase